MAYEDVYRRSIEQPEAFWGEEAKAIHWHVPPQQVLDYSTPPFRRWFVGGQTNLCYNAVDRHLAERGDQLVTIEVQLPEETGEAWPDLIRRLVREHEVLITIEEGSVGGFSSFVLQYLATSGLLDGLEIEIVTWSVKVA